ncbi:MAG: ankyrin repeat domain-containing protein [Mariprofundaceae bacterium]|nr:ankyrin repeat domain-containing protein [Mariprofundaceae bacterium]
MPNTANPQDLWFHAAQNHDQETLKTCLLAQPDLINHSDSKHNTALHHAAKKTDIDMMIWLISQGAEPGTLNLRHDTPLHFAERNEQAIRVLLEAGANPNIRNKDWNYPYYFAFYGAMTPEITRLYIKHGAELMYIEKDD